MSSADRVRVMVVDDHPTIRNGLRETFEASGRLKVVGLAADGEEAVKTVETLRPEVIVMDAVMPRKDGVEACREIMELLPKTRVLMLTASAAIDAVVVAVAAGAAGYLQKYSPPEELIDAVLDVANGRWRLPDKALTMAFAMARGERDRVPSQAAGKLTAVERETLTLFARGRSYAQIAESTGNRASTVRNTVFGIQKKLNVETMQDLVIWAMRNGLLDHVRVEDRLVGQFFKSV